MFYQTIYKFYFETTLSIFELNFILDINSSPKSTPKDFLNQKTIFIPFPNTLTVLSKFDFFVWLLPNNEQKIILKLCRQKKCVYLKLIIYMLMWKMWNTCRIIRIIWIIWNLSTSKIVCPDFLWNIFPLSFAEIKKCCNR